MTSANNNNMETKVGNEEELLKSVFGITFCNTICFAKIYYCKLGSIYTVDLRCKNHNYKKQRYKFQTVLPVLVLTGFHGALFIGDCYGGINWGSSKK